MAKDLKTSVKLDTKSAVAALDKLEKKINHINNVVNKTNSRNSGLSKAINNASRSADTLSKKVNQVTSANNKAASSASKIAKGYQKSNSAVSVLTKNLRTLISTYVGLMGAQAVLNTSDLLTSAENKLNYVNGGDRAQTAETMDKTYAAAQRSRGSYTDMLSNVAKTMTLAGDAFQGNVDNAIRFQEIMSKAYTVGGASAAEQASSMYQLVQALGSGILQGDELRSVREGAPIAYKAIEKFAQGVYKTDESLKDLASQGKITSDMVVAAMMDAGAGIDKAFAQTDMTFAQAFTNVKNMAVQAFTPVLQMLNDALNSDAGKAAIQGIGDALVLLANSILWVMKILGKFFGWCADNWYWLRWIVYGVVAAIVAHLAIMAAQAVITGIKSFIAFITGLSPLYIWIVVIGIVVAAIVWLANTAVSGCEFIFYALLMVAAGLVLVAILTQAWWLLWVALAIAVVALIIMFIEQIVGAVYWMGAVCQNVGYGIANFFIACWEWVKAAGYNAMAFIVNTSKGLYNVVGAVAENIKIAFTNAWNGALESFWNFIAGCLEGVSKLAPVIDAIAEAFGKEGFSIEAIASDARAKADSYAAKQQEYVSISDAWASGMATVEYKDLGDAWSNGLNTFEYKNLGEAYNNGAAKGAEWSNAINEFGVSLKDKISGFNKDFNLPDMLEKLGMGNVINDKLGTSLPNPNDPAYGVGEGYDPSDALGKISDNVGDIKDSMDLSNEDLEYLRKIADMEWKKEFTTANITVDMTNNNNVNGEYDLHSLAIGLRDMIEEEMFAVANGVYA